MKNKIEDLRNHLFSTIEALLDAEKPMEVARGQAIASVAQVLVNSARVECEHMKITGSKGSGFIPVADQPQLQIAPPLEKSVESHTQANNEPKPTLPPTKELQQTITEVNGFKVGNRVFLPNGKHGTVRSVTAAGRIDVEHDNGGVFPYAAKQISHATDRPAVKSPIAPPGPVPRFVAGRDDSGSRGG